MSQPFVPDARQTDPLIQKFMINTGGGRYKCTECPDFDFTCFGNLRAHIECHHYSPGYKCQFCEKVFRIRNVHSRHVKKHLLQYQFNNWEIKGFCRILLFIEIDSSVWDQNQLKQLKKNHAIKLKNTRAHMASKRFSPGYSCPLCNQEFKIKT